MLTTKEVRNVKVCKPAKPGKEYTKDGTPRRRGKIGKIFKTVFSTDGMSVVGFIVRQPDFLWMIKRPERFLALDSFDIQEGMVVPTKGWDSWDDRAIKRMGIDYDNCLLWEGIYVHDPAGNEIGHVDEISFDETTGKVGSFFLDDGGIARSLIGSVEIPAELVIGYKKGYLIVEPEALDLNPSGGLAAKAGMATAKATNDVKEAGKKAGEAAGKVAGKAAEKGAQGVGKLISRTKHMVTDTRDEFREASGSKKAPSAVKAAAEKAASEKAAAEKSAKAKGASSAKPAEAKAASSKSTSAKQTSAKSTSGTKAASSKTTTTTKPATEKTASGKKSVGAAASEHLQAAGSMFSNFKKEFDKASKGK